jgi:hypothetical protein
VLLAVGADIVGRQIAESRAGEAIATRTGNQVAPDVTIHGFSFLVQAIPGKYDDITLTSHGLTLGPLTGVDASVDLYDVTYPLSSAFSGTTDGLAAGSGALVARIPTSALSSALQSATGVSGVTVGSGPNGTVQLTASVPVGTVRVSVTATLAGAVADGKLTLSATGASAGGAAVPAGVDLEKFFSLSVPLTALPVQITSGSIATSGSDLVLRATTGPITADALR